MVPASTSNLSQVKPTFFATAAELRDWLERNHVSETELIVGFYKRGSGKPSITWQELVDEELCFGWIDGVRKGIDEVSYSNRITPRTPRSTWSAINIARAEELIRLGRMRPVGLKAFERRTGDRSAIYSYEQRTTANLDSDGERSFRANKKAWAFFQAQAPSYRRAATWWVISAKRDGTRKTRLAALIADSERGRAVGALSRPPRRRG
jgi:uncharacterized protein YdeI (YjbR/CyaY-like superfamily)